MPDVLSQAQIDALLKGVNQGEITMEEQSDEKRMRDYDFYSPRKFTKEQLRNVDSIHENLARVLSSYFSGSLRVSSEVRMLQVEEQRYYEFNNALPDTALIALLTFIPADKNINEFTLMMEVSPSISFFMIERLLGGSGTGRVLNREFTEIELGIMNSVCTKIASYMGDAWRDYIDVEVHFDTIETNPRLIQIYAPEDIVVIVSSSVKLEQQSGSINICIPAIGLEEALGAFVSKYTRMSAKLTDENKKEIWQRVIRRAIYSSDLEMCAVLDKVQMELNDILHLQVNDVIRLEKPVDGDVTVLVDNEPWFDGKMGTVKSSKAVKLIRSHPRETLQ